jgi:hypothetical protein
VARELRARLAVAFREAGITATAAPAADAAGDEPDATPSGGPRSEPPAPR